MVLWETKFYCLLFLFHEQWTSIIILYSLLCCTNTLKVWMLCVTFRPISFIFFILQLDVTCFITSLFTAQHVSNVSTSIFRSLRLIVDLFHVLYCSGSKCVGVTAWFSWVVWCPYAGFSSASACIRIPHHPAEPHRNTNTHRTRAIQHMK